MDGHVFLHVLVSPRRNHREPAGARTHFCHETYWASRSIIFLLEIDIQTLSRRSSPRCFSGNDYETAFLANVQQVFSGAAKNAFFADSIVQFDPSFEPVRAEFVDLLFYQADRSLTSDEAEGSEPLALHERDEFGWQGEI